MQQSDTLTKFYRAYLEWVDSGAVWLHEGYFNPARGLCANFKCMLPVHNSCHGNFEAYMEMKEQFTTAGLCRIYPFGTSKQFEIELYNETFHLNPVRMAWVRERATIPLSTEV